MQAHLFPKQIATPSFVPIQRVAGKKRKLEAAAKDPFLTSCIVYFLNYGQVIPSRKISTERTWEYGGTVLDRYHSNATHIVVDSNARGWVGYLRKQKWREGDKPAIVDCKWLSSCMREKKCVPIGPFEASPADDPAEAPQEPEVVVVAAPEKDVTDEKRKVKEGQAEFIKRVFAERGGVVDPDAKENNSRLVTILDEVADLYKTIKDEFRYVTYAKAAVVIKQLPFTLRSEKTMSGVRGFGKRITKCIEEILETGMLQLLIELRKQNAPLLELTNVWGIGGVVAAKLTAQGVKSVADLKAKVAAGTIKLNRAQLIGLKYYEEMQLKMDRAEAEEIISFVDAEVKKIDPRCSVIGVGSYRRGEEMLSDCDLMLLPAPGEEFADHITDPLIEALGQRRFMTEMLYRRTPKTSKPGKTLEALKHRCITFYGMCKLPGEGRVNRRVDIKSYPRSQLAFAMIQWTGNTFFNRFFRLQALQQGYSLSDHRLCPCQRDRRGNITWRGPSLICETEEDVFNALGLEYLPPTQRRSNAPLLQAKKGAATPALSSELALEVLIGKDGEPDASDRSSDSK